MIKRIQERYECSEKEAELYYFAYINNLTHLVRILNVSASGEFFYENIFEKDLKELETVIPDNRALYDEVVLELGERGIDNKRLLSKNSYNTIVYSRTLGTHLNKYCHKYGKEYIIDRIEEYYKHAMRSTISTMTLLNFFKDLNGNGINYYIEKHNELFL